MKAKRAEASGTRRFTDAITKRNLGGAEIGRLADGQRLNRVEQSRLLAR